MIYCLLFQDNRNQDFYILCKPLLIFFFSQFLISFFLFYYKNFGSAVDAFFAHGCQVFKGAFTNGGEAFELSGLLGDGLVGDHVSL